MTKAQMQLLHVAFTNWPFRKLLPTYSTGKATTSGQYMFIHKTLNEQNCTPFMGEFIWFAKYQITGTVIGI